MGNSPTYRNLHLLINLFKLRAGVGLVNLVQLGIIGSSAINTISSSSPRSTRRSITFVGRAFILVGELIKINVTFSHNRLGIRIVHTTVDNHLIHTTELIILLIHDRASAKHLITRPTNNFSGSTIRNCGLGHIFVRSNLHRKLNLLHILRIDTRVPLSNKRLIGILIANLVRLRLVVKGENTVLAYLSTHGALIIKYILATGTNNNLRSCITGTIHINTVRSNNTVIHRIGNLIRGTLETNTAETERICNLYREYQRIPPFNLARSIGQLHTTV